MTLQVSILTSTLAGLGSLATSWGGFGGCSVGGFAGLLAVVLASAACCNRPLRTSKCTCCCCCASKPAIWHIRNSYVVVVVFSTLGVLSSTGMGIWLIIPEGCHCPFALEGCDKDAFCKTKQDLCDAKRCTADAECRIAISCASLDITRCLSCNSSSSFSSWRMDCCFPNRPYSIASPDDYGPGQGCVDHGTTFTAQGSGVCNEKERCLGGLEDYSAFCYRSEDTVRDALVREWGIVALVNAGFNAILAVAAFTAIRASNAMLTSTVDSLPPSTGAIVIGKNSDS